VKNISPSIALISGTNRNTNIIYEQRIVQDNIIIGLNAGTQVDFSDSLSGFGNIFIGDDAGRYNTSGYGNVFQGVNAGGANTIGNLNTFIGGGAGFTNTTGDYNVFQGYWAGAFNTNGSNNVAIGDNAGAYYGAGFVNSNFDNSILIGSKTKTGGASQTNQIVIGYEALGLGSNTTVIGNSGTTQTHVHGGLTIGSTTAPASMLDVVGSGNTLTTTTARFRNSSLNTVLFLRDDIRVGINNTSPAQTIHITGTMRLTALVEGTPTTILSRDSTGDVMGLSVGSGLTISGGTLVMTGSSGGSGIAGTIATGQIAYGTATNTVGGTNNLFWDNANVELGIGTNAPARTLHVAGTMRLTGSTGTGTTLMARDANGDISAVGFDSNLTLTNNTLRYIGSAVTGTGAPTGVAFWDTSSSISSDNRLYWDNTTKRLGIGTSSPNQTLEVAGTMRLTGSTGTPITLMGRNTSGDISKIDVGAGLSLVGDDLVVLTATGITGSGTATQIAFFSGSTVIRSDSNLYWDNTNKRVGIATTSPITPLDVRGKSAFGDSNITSSNTERALNLIGADAVMRILRISANSVTASPAFELMHRTTANGTNTVFYDFYVSSSGFFIRNRLATPAPGVERIAIDSSGRVLFGGASFTSSAAMQVSSTTGGFLPPKVTTTQRDAIGSPVSGLMVYNTSTNQMQFYNGSSWVSM
ncbi:MAG: YapH protein, partial [Cyanobacteriota bacterium]